MAKTKVAKPAATVAEDKSAAAAKARDAINTKYGEGSIQDMGTKVGRVHPCIPSGIYDLDNRALGIGGVPRGRIIEIFGPEASGKTTITLQIIAEAQKAGGLAAFVDAEHALDPNWATKLSVDMGALDVSQPDYGEQALEIVEMLVRSGAYAIVVVDSVAALTPQAELNGEMGDSHMGLQARMMSQAMRKLTAAVDTSMTTLIFINQIRDKIGVMFGSPETTTGGKALKFYASVRLDVRRIATVKEGEHAIGNRVKIKVVKNKMAAPYRETEVDLLFASGFNTIGSVVEAGVANGAVDKSGAWYSFEGERLGQGVNNVVTLLRGSQELYDRVYAAVKAADEVSNR